MKIHFSCEKFFFKYRRK